MLKRSIVYAAAIICIAIGISFVSAEDNIETAGIVRQLDTLLKQKDSQIQQLSQELKATQTKNLESQLVFDKQKTDLLKANESLLAKSKQQEDRLDTLTRQKDSQIQQLSQELAELNKAKANLLQELKATQEKSRENQLAFDRQKADLLKANESLLTKSKQQEDRLDTLNRQKDSQIQQLSQELAGTDQKLEQARSELADPHKKAEGLKLQLANLHYNLGVLLLGQNNFKEASREFEKVLNFKPDDADSYYNLGLIYDEYLADRKKAKDCYLNYLRLNPKAKDAQRVKQWIEGK